MPKIGGALGRAGLPLHLTLTVQQQYNIFSGIYIMQNTMVKGGGGGMASRGNNEIRS